jgi:hypothetical protein
LAQLRQQKLVIDAGEEEADVGGEHPAVRLGGLDEVAQGAVAAIAAAIGIGAAQEPALQGRGDHGAEGVVWAWK